MLMEIIVVVLVMIVVGGGGCDGEDGDSDGDDGELFVMKMMVVIGFQKQLTMILARDIVLILPNGVKFILQVLHAMILQKTIMKADTAGTVS